MKHLTVAVTGASGMVGYHVVRHLAERGLTVKALVRQSSDTQALSKVAGAVSIARVALSDRSGLVEALKGADAVVHAAGSVDPLARREEITAVNVEGTRSCLSAALEAGVKHFLHVSSLSVITGQGDQYGLTEAAPLVYCGEAYADSKVDAEKAVMAYAGGQAIKVTILRPGFIYGPGERAWMPRLINSLAAGKAMLIDGGAKETNVIYVENLCRAVELALSTEASYGQVYNLTDGQKVTKKELFDAICDGLGYPRVTRTIPGPVARLVCEAVSTVAPFLPMEMRRKLGRYSRAAFRLAGVNQGFDITKAERELGYTDRIPFAEGMRRTLAHFGARPAGRQTREVNVV
ncbi:MAG TPA: NAD-dependent epimerase/dehydratase family protein [Candidatus Obscuribacterales bacterium]